MMIAVMERNQWIPERFNKYLTGFGDGFGIDVRVGKMFRMNARFLQASRVLILIETGSIRKTRCEQAWDVQETG